MAYCLPYQYFFEKNITQKTTIGTVSIQVIIGRSVISLAMKDDGGCKVVRALSQRKWWACVKAVASPDPCYRRLTAFRMLLTLQLLVQNWDSAGIANHRPVSLTTVMCIVFQRNRSSYSVGRAFLTSFY